MAKLPVVLSEITTPQGGAVLVGVQDLERFLRAYPERVIKKAGTAAVRAALAQVARAVRSQVAAAPAASSQLKAEVRKTVGLRFLRGGLDKRGVVHQQVAKVGYGVGMTGKRRESKLAKAKARGESISLANVHWPVLGTEQRTQKTSGRATGAMPPFFKRCIRAAVSSSGEAAMAKAVAKAKQVAIREAIKLRKLRSM